MPSLTDEERSRLIAADPLAQAAARARRLAPYLEDAARFEASSRADLVVGIHEPEPDFDWSPNVR